MQDLIALLVPGGRSFVEQVERAWDEGDAVLPLDPAAPVGHLDQVIASLAPTRVVEADGQVRSLHGGRPVQEGDALVIATSGTTGVAKGVVHTRASVEAAGYMTAVATGTSVDSTWLACLPLSHVGGFSVISRALIVGAGLEVHPAADATDIDDAAARGATHVSLVPTLLRRVDAPRWRTILLGGSAIPPIRPANTIATYGMTETMGGVVYDGLALPGVEVRVVLEHGSAAEPGAVGMIELRSPTLLRAYRDGGSPLDDGGWFRSGDLGRIDPATTAVEIHGRSDDLIITGGVKVWPEPVEEVLRADRRIRDVAVVGLADPEWGHRVVAFVVPEDPGDPPALEDLRSLVRDRLPRAAAPKQLMLLDSLPRTGLGKIRRSFLSTGEVLPRHG